MSDFLELTLPKTGRRVLVAIDKILTVTPMEKDKKGTFVAFEAGGAIEVVETYEAVQTLLHIAYTADCLYISSKQPEEET